ncbi:MAG: type II toxin-antitoxin system VapC family toxin [Candidatus Hydrogenedentes bacterium]|nr:type II toxin-antitoxin system VapC family toxin [Candidatus Hydrogenedentota bacterium]
MYLLDTNACIRILNNSSRVLVTRLQSEDSSVIRLCSIVKAELLYGARHSDRSTENLAILGRFFAAFISLPFDDRCAEFASIIRSTLATRGRPIGPNDILIAATAMAHNLTLVTHNSREFSRVDGLQIDDWE